MRRLTLWQVDNVVRQQGLLEKVGKGWWRNKSADEADTPIEDEPESIEPVPEYDGWVYAFSFPTLVKTDAPFQIKVGKASDVDSRVAEQTRGSAFFERAVILGRWQANRVNSVERAIHDVLKARGKWLVLAPVEY